jgi:hypothetical protein
MKNLRKKQDFKSKTNATTEATKEHEGNSKSKAHRTFALLVQAPGREISDALPCPGTDDERRASLERLTCSCRCGYSL